MAAPTGTAPPDAAGGPEEAPLDRRVLAGINRIFRERLSCDTEEQLAKTCLAVAEELTGSQFGFIGEINSRGLFDTIALSDPGYVACTMPDSEATNLVQNMSLDGVDRSTMKEGRSRIVNDVPSHPESKDIPEGHPPVHRFLGVPLKQGDQTVGMIGLGNKPTQYVPADQQAIEGLGVAMLEAIYSKRAQDQLTRQTEEILAISTPVMQIWEGIVVAPLIGTLDSRRTQQFMERLLEMIVSTSSPMALVDITGVPAVDTLTAQNLIETVTAARLLGSNVILTGLRPNIAQTLVGLGADMGDIDTSASLAAGLRLALGRSGLAVVPDGRAG